MAQFKYRFVPFGTRFAPAPGAPRTDASERPTALHENELALDVGGVCWGYDGELLSVLDHHFHRPTGQFPSAAAAVLHNAQRIHDRLAGHDGDVWLVAHQQPDFDAFAAMYLARCILTGEAPTEGWEEFGIGPEGWFRGAREINWFMPHVAHLPDERRWPVLLAAYAACVDNCRRLSSPKNRSLHSILYAALRRGRNYADETSGATEFFDEAREAIRRPEQRLNPLFDSVLEGSRRFAPELTMLDGQLAAYERDIARSRRALVLLPASSDSFAQWFVAARERPLLDAGGKLDLAHVEPPNQHYEQADGIYLRDPECLLFKEWVRGDVENSSMGEGFLFSAVAYSDGRPEARTNATSYFFSLDPERAAGRHLYNVWARLEAAELDALQAPANRDLFQQLTAAEAAAAAREEGPKTICRSDFGGRAGSFRACFDDPWFDGANYECTIIATPNRGTLIGRAGADGDLSDDPVVAIVHRELEHSVFVGGPGFDDSQGAEQDSASAAAGADGPRREPGESRFGQIELREDVDILRGQMAEQVGRILWRYLHPEAGAGVPDDFLHRHLFRTRDWIGVWSRRGIIVANKRHAAETAEGFRNVFEELIDLSREIRLLAETELTADNGEEMVAHGESLMRRVVTVKHLLALPQNRLPGRFFEASGLAEVLGMLRDVNEAAVEKVRSARSDSTLAKIRDLNLSAGKSLKESTELQGKVEWLEVFIFAVYIAELIHIVGDSLRFNGELVGYGALAYSLLGGWGAYYVLNPKEHVKLPRLTPGLLFVGAALLIGFLVAGWKLPKEEPRGPAPSESRSSGGLQPPETGATCSRNKPKRVQDSPPTTVNGSKMRPQQPEKGARCSRYYRKREQDAPATTVNGSKMLPLLP